MQWSNQVKFLLDLGVQFFLPVGELGAGVGLLPNHLLKIVSKIYLVKDSLRDKIILTPDRSLCAGSVSGSCKKKISLESCKKCELSDKVILVPYRTGSVSGR